MTSSRGSFKANFFEMTQIPNQPVKIINRAFDKISLLFQTVLESEARNLSPTVQLDFSWTLQITDQQNARFARASDSLRSSQSTMCSS